MDNLFSNLEFRARANRLLPAAYIQQLIKTHGDKYWDAVAKVDIEHLTLAFREEQLERIVADGYSIDVIKAEMIRRLTPRLEQRLKKYAVSSKTKIDTDA
jgi:hypothetical protein